MKLAIALTLALAPICAVYPAAAQTLPEFEAAVIKPSEIVSAPIGPGRGPMMRALPALRGGPGTTEPGEFRCTNCSLEFLIGLAYRLRPMEVADQDWMYFTNYDLIAKVPVGSTRHDVALMLQQLLIERFQLTSHFVRKQLPALVLSVGKQPPKLQPAEARGPSQPTPDPLLTNCLFQLTGHANSMQQLAEALSEEVHSPVVDMTGLKGNFDFSFAWYPSESLAGGGCKRPRVPAGRDPADAVRHQLGLRVDARKILRDDLVVDSALKIPREY